MSADYPRDLIGYGNNPPHPHWPGDARIALSFVLNYEEGGERCVLHGDKESEAFLSEMVAAQPLQGVRHMSMESLYEYGSRTGSGACSSCSSDATCRSPCSPWPWRRSATLR